MIDWSLLDVHGLLLCEDSGAKAAADSLASSTPWGILSNLSGNFIDRSAPFIACFLNMSNMSFRYDLMEVLPNEGHLLIDEQILLFSLPPLLHPMDERLGL